MFYFIAAFDKAKMIVNILFINLNVWVFLIFSRHILLTFLAAIKYFDLLFVFNSIRDIEKSSEELDRFVEKTTEAKVPDIRSYNVKKVVQFMQNRHVTANFRYSTKIIQKYVKEMFERNMSFRLTKKVTPTVDEDWNVSYLNYVLVQPSIQSPLGPK